MYSSQLHDITQVTQATNVYGHVQFNLSKYTWEI